MTLLEIVVRDWSYWRGAQRLFQDADGDLIASDGYCFQTVCGHAEIASDRETAIVTERKWREAQRTPAQKDSK